MAEKTKHGDAFVAVVAVDGSKHAETAFKWYLEQIHRPGSFVYLVTCLDTPRHGIFTDPYMAEEVWCAMVNQEKENAQEFLKPCLDILAKHNISGKYIMEGGHNPGEILVKVAEDVNANLIVVGSRGLGTFRRTILGSVSNYVMHHARCPVIVCKHP